MKKLQFISLIVLGLTLILSAAGGILLPLPDWAVRVNGVVMMVMIALFAFASVRLLKKV